MDYEFHMADVVCVCVEYRVVVVLPSIFWLSHTFTVPSLEAVAKMQCSSDTRIRFTAALCSWRWATRSPLGCQPERGTFYMNKDNKISFNLT